MELILYLRDSLHGRLVSEGIFKSVLRAPEPADFDMSVDVIDARHVSAAARIMVGVMAGHNAAELSVQVKNHDTKQLVVALDVEGTSASHPFSPESGLDDAIREAVNNVIKGLR